ncbi:MAG TPA: sensor histidine kinase [Methylomirabilota bacterium]|nr:sensor histidine kinase [Methylomirabilota bacterium]
MLVFWISFASTKEAWSANQQTNLLEIHLVTANGKIAPFHAGGELRVGPNLQNIGFIFGTATNSGWMPVRLRFMLKGYDTAWHNSGEMDMVIRFYDEKKKLIDRKVFKAEGESAGWTGSLKDSALIYRRETLIVPPGASNWNAVISSAGPPETVGIYVVDNLIVSRLSPTNGSPDILLQPILEGLPGDDFADQTPEGWVRDGIQPSMAKIVGLGEAPKKRAFAIIDDDPHGHAEWRSRIENMPNVAPADRLLVEWNEMFSMGEGGDAHFIYQKVPPGVYQFCVEEVDIFGVPTGVKTSLEVRVRVPLWQTPWFWVAVAATLISASAVGIRYVASKKMRREVLRFKQLRALEQERLRIARDIHDDLGARVTQISMLSAMAPENSGFPQNAREDFDRISSMSRDLITALYETVWAVNPENDSLYAVGNYLRQMTGQLCEPAQLRCRFHIPTLPRDVQISSQTRHNIIMAVKESVHNVIKHANASELNVHVTFARKLLTISIQDDGRGFNLASHLPGNGLANLKRRMEDMGGSCIIESRHGHGTSINLCLKVEEVNNS